MTDLDPAEPDRSTGRRRRSRQRTDSRTSSTVPTSATPSTDAAPRPASKAERDAERGLRGLIGAGPSQVGPTAAMRARDASQPSEEDLAAAEKDTVLIRRHYVPSETAPFE